jgi:hypothetical protein
MSQFFKLETILKLNLFKYKTLFEVLFINCGMGHGMPGVVSLPFKRFVNDYLYNLMLSNNLIPIMGI